MKRNLLLVGLAGALVASASAQTMLSAGDLAIVGYNSSNPDTVKMVTMVNLEANTTFTLTDYGWLSTTNALRVGGGGYVTVRLSSAMAAGSVLGIQREDDGTWTSNSGLVADVWDGGANPEFAPSAAGDGIIVFQGPFDDTTGVVSGNLLYAINADGGTAPANGWQANATSSNTSALPTGLVDGTTALGLVRTDGDATWATEFNNYRYIGTRTGTRTELLSSIGSRANWEGIDTPAYEFDKTAFQVVPEPMTIAALGLGLAAVARRRNRR